MKVEIKRYRSGKLNGHIRKRVVEIDDYDVWNCDYTLAQIILPMLIVLKESKQGAPNVADEDVPEELRCSPEVDKDEINWEWKDENYFKRWDWALSEMIFAMEEIANERPNEPKLFKDTGVAATSGWKKDLGMNEMEFLSEMQEEYDSYHARIQNGCRLFGSYYTSLWS